MPDPRTALLVFALVAGVLLLVAWPRRGLVARVRRLRRLTERVRLEDALKHLYHATAAGGLATADGLAGALQVPRARALDLLARLEARGLARADGAGVALTDEGRAYALRLVRTHRLLEHFLADRTGVQPAEWHDLAEEREHEMTGAQVEALAARLGQPRYDPHGDPIPTATGELPAHDGVPLSALAAGEGGTIVHIEDEPREVFERLQREGLALGQLLVVRELAGSAVEVEVEGRVLTLPRVIAPAVTVVRRPAERTMSPRTLAALRPGETGRVARLSAACHGAQRRRLLDLGVVPGTDVTAEFASAAGDPVAYRVRGALVALRRQQAAWIELEPAGAPPREAA